MNRRIARHLGAFLSAGTLAFAIDALVLLILTRLLGVDPFLARIAAISLAMVAGWLAHRTFTFRLKTAPTPAEFLRYAGVAWGVAAVNYAVYAAILLLIEATPPLAAMVISSLVAMVVSYAGMRLAVFRVRDPH